MKIVLENKKEDMTQIINDLKDNTMILEWDQNSKRSYLRRDN
jgi:hypothetical protein